MNSNWTELTAPQLLALLAANLAPLKRHGDGLWRCAANGFPAAGVHFEDLDALCLEGLAEVVSASAIITEAGRAALEASPARSVRSPVARSGTQGAHLSLQ